MEDYADREAAEKAFRANTSMRYRRIDSLERWVSGTQYDGKQSWWDETGNTPLWDRAPCIVYPIVHIAIGSHVDLVLGENRFPLFTSKPDEDEADEASGLSPEHSHDLDRFVSEYHRLSRFRAHCREAFGAAMGAKSVCAIHGHRGGVPFNELIPAKWCAPEFDAQRRVTRLEIRYPYLEEYQQQNGKWALRAKLYRRVIDDKSDTTYKSADAQADGREPSWSVDPALTVSHGLGFCPVIWYPFMRGCVPVNVYDGRAIHETILDEIQAHDIALSQRHRGALLTEPQVVEIGVPPGYNPTDVGRTPLVITTEKGSPAGPGGTVNPGPENRITGHFGAAGPGAEARKKGPGWVWQYTSTDAKVSVLNYPSESLKAQSENAEDIRRKIQDTLAVVMLDPDSLKFAASTSGKALEALKERQIDRCDQYRDDLKENFLLPSVDMQLRIAAKVGAALKVSGAAKVRGLLAKFLSQIGSEWLAPSLQVKWGPYARPAEDDQQKVAATIVQLKTAGLLTQRAAIQKLTAAGIIGVESIDEYIKSLEDEKAKAQEEAQKQAQDQHGREMELQHTLAKTLKNGDAGGARAGQGGKPNPPPS